jgi:photosystem II stability/assembly factor-like uncharacterized protein
MKNNLYYLLATCFWLNISIAQKSKNTPATVDNKYISALTWRNIGPFRGGRSCAVTGVPGKPNLFYFGSTGGGVWRTTDGGNSWENISDSFFGGSIGHLDVSLSDPNVIFVGTGEKTVRGNVSGGDGVYKSVDAGKTWTKAGLENSRHIGRVRIHPKNPDIVFVAAMGDLFKDTPDRGVYKTIDGGKTWRNILFADAGSGAVDLTFDPTNPRILYASTWTHRRTPYSFSSGGQGSKLWKSTDEGETWFEISNKPGFAKGLLGIMGVTVSPANPNRIWAMVENEAEGGVYRSENGGDTWQKVNDSRDLRQRAWYYTRIYADTKDPNKVYVLNVNYHVSTDGGQTFKSHNAPHGDHHDLWIAPEDPERMIIADDGGAQVTFDGGKNWSTYHNQPTAQFYRVSVDNHFPFRIYGGQQDNTSVRILHRSSGGFIDEQDWQETAGGETAAHAINPENNDIVFGGEYGGLMIRVNHKTEDMQVTSVWPNNPLGHGVEDMKYRFQWNYPVFYSIHNNKRLYTFSNHVHYSEDLGKTWQLMSPDLTTNDKTKQGPSGGPITKDNTSVEYYCTIFCAAESKTDANVLWTGSDDGLIHVTRDGGKSWQNVTPAALPKFTQINSIEADPHNEGGLFVAATRYKWGDYEPYLFYTKDFGKTWMRIDNGINRGHFTRAIRAVADKEGLLFAGTENGIYVSFDTGKNWQSFQNNLPLVPITDLVVKDRHLIAATQGRSFWIVDDITPLFELHATFNKNVHVFAPKPTWLMAGGYYGKSKTAGENHPNGAIIHYYLPYVDTAANTYALRFKDANGTVVREFSTKAENKNNLWTPKEGSQRFVWDMRTDGVDAVDGMVLWWVVRGGAHVLPGKYTVEMQIGDEILTVSLQINIDPRLDISAEELQQRYDFLIRVRDKMNEMNTAIKEMREVRSQITSLKSKVEDESLKNDLDSLFEKNMNIEKNLSSTLNLASERV